jgi:hypothetical protein
MVNKDIWEKIKKLDDERREIQKRLLLRAAIKEARKNGVKEPYQGRIWVENLDSGKHLVTEPEIKQMSLSSATTDAYRYVKIQDECWTLLGLTRHTGRGQVAPDYS